MALAGVLTRLGRVWAMWPILPILPLLCLAGCNSEKTSTTSKVLVVPEPAYQTTAYISDQMDMTRQVLYLWYEDGGCKLEVNVKGVSQGEKRWLKPTGPCYFVRSPGSDQVQVYQEGKAKQVVAVLGTPVPTKKPDSRCGRELQGLIIKGSEVMLSSNTRSGSVYCAHQGLDNFQYGLFAEE